MTDDGGILTFALVVAFALFVVFMEWRGYRVDDDGRVTKPPAGKAW